jgi:hypothetical protein
MAKINNQKKFPSVWKNLAATEFLKKYKKIFGTFNFWLRFMIYMLPFNMGRFQLDRVGMYQTRSAKEYSCFPAAARHALDNRGGNTEGF